MACDSELLERVGAGESPPTVRFFGWDPPAISLGRHQPALEPAAADALRDLGVEWVRRPTGGRAVYHGRPDEELTYSVVAPLDALCSEGGLVDVYRRIHAALAAGLESLGVAAELAPRPDSSRPPGPRGPVACFASSVQYEVTVGGRKLLGSAQRRARHALLQHGSLPLHGGQAPLAAAWPGVLDGRPPLALAEAAGRRIPFDRVAGALATAFADRLGIRLEPGELSEAERVAIEDRAALLPRLDTRSRPGRYFQSQPTA